MMAAPKKFNKSNKPSDRSRATGRQEGGGRYKSKDEKSKPDFKRGDAKDTSRYAGKPKSGGRYKKSFKSKVQLGKPENDGLTRLNKFIANAGVCSRREADKLIEQGLVTVNNEIITELGYKIKPDDKVKYAGHILKGEALRYVLMNKPKDYITTSKDPQNRKTVMHLVANLCKERIYPVGRLDRNTTGLLLFTNDGEMAKKLSHPKFGYTKIYHVWLDKNLKASDMDKIAKGLELEDGTAEVDSIAYVNGASKREVGLELHSGKNRIVRRIFAHLGYTVVKLDRVSFAGLTKKDLPRGKCRHLTEQELNMLKMTIK